MRYVGPAELAWQLAAERNVAAQLAAVRIAAEHTVASVRHAGGTRPPSRPWQHQLQRPYPHPLLLLRPQHQAQPRGRHLERYGAAMADMHLTSMQMAGEPPASPPEEEVCLDRILFASRPTNDTRICPGPVGPGSALWPDT